jgi:hypothetical protein
MGDAESMATDLKAALDKIKDPALKDLIVTASGDKPNEVCLADLAVADPEKLQADYEIWKKASRDKDNPDRGKRFDDWLRDKATPEQPGTITDPAGLVEYGLDNAGAKRSFEAMISDDPSREAAIFRDTATGECVAVQGGHSFVEGRSWQMLKENFRNGDPAEWHLEIHYHPNRGLAFGQVCDRLAGPGLENPVRDRIWVRSRGRTPVLDALSGRRRHHARREFQRPTLDRSWRRGVSAVSVQQGSSRSRDRRAGRERHAGARTVTTPAAAPGAARG